MLSQINTIPKNTTNLDNSRVDGTIENEVLRRLDPFSRHMSSTESEMISADARNQLRAFFRADTLRGGFDVA